MLYFEEESRHIFVFIFFIAIILHMNLQILYKLISCIHHGYFSLFVINNRDNTENIKSLPWSPSYTQFTLFLLFVSMFFCPIKSSYNK